jgi:hypothetical protein
MMIRGALFRKQLSSLFVALCLLFAPEAMAEPFDFVALGDMPYGKDQVGSLEKKPDRLGKTLADKKPPFVIHYGDLKAGYEKCDSKLLKERKEIVYDLIDGPVFYTPGDNDWTDCDRGENGFNELNRLMFLRKMFFSGDEPTKLSWNIVRPDAKHPENVRWEFGGVQFVALHIVGTGNGREKEEIERSNWTRAWNAVDVRDAANLDLLAEAFKNVNDKKLKALVVAIHADPFDLPEGWPVDKPCTAELREGCNPYFTFLKTLNGKASAFDKPVLLIHGSTNPFCLDRRFGGWQAPKLWRLNGPGDFVHIDAAVVRFDADSDVPFTVRSLMTNIAAADCGD